MSSQNLKTGDILTDGVMAIRDQVRDVNTSKNIHSNIKSGVYKIQEGYLGYISCFPKNETTEESIDAVFQILARPDSVDIMVDVSWSNGELIKEIGKVNIPNFPDQIERLKDFMTRIAPLVVDTFDQLLSN